MTDEKEKPLSPAMVSALLAVAQMRGDSTIVWLFWPMKDQADICDPETDDAPPEPLAS